MGFAQKGVAVSANSSPGLDCLPVEICSMDLEVHPCQFSDLYNDLQINFTKSVDYTRLLNSPNVALKVRLLFEISESMRIFRQFSTSRFNFKTAQLAKNGQKTRYNPFDSGQGQHFRF